MGDGGLYVPVIVAFMTDEKRGLDGSKYFAMVVMMAERIPSLRGVAMDRLIAAVVYEHQQRARCRDTDVAAATRVRSW